MEKVISYIGSKVKLYDFLDEIIISNYDKKENYNFMDLFSGTNSVSHYIKKNTNWNVFANDFSNYSNVIFSFLHFDLITLSQQIYIINKLEYLDKLELISSGDIFNEFSANGIPKTIDEDLRKEMFENQPFQSRMFFSEKVGKKIDTIKTQIIKWIEEGILKDEVEINILLTFLLHYVDKNSNTTSVYGAYLKNTKKMIKETPFLNDNLLQQLKVSKKTTKNEYRCFNQDIIEILDNFAANKKNKNIIYLDPPYSTRSYESNYHILEYISDLNFNINIMKQNSKTGQRIEKSTNPFNSKSKTLEIFEEMIDKSLKISNNVYISYSTDGLVTENDVKEIYDLLKLKYNGLKLKTHKKSYKRFKASSNPELKKLQQEKNKLLNIKNISLEQEIRIKEIDIELIKDRNYIKDITKDMKVLSSKKIKTDSDLENLSKLQIEISKNKESLEVFEIIWHFSKDDK